MKAKLTRFHIKRTDKWLGYSTADTIWDELSELERLAEIGRATEKAFENKYLMMKMGSNSQIKGTIENLLNWAKEVTHDS